MKQAFRKTLIFATTLLLADAATAQQPIFYPAKGQSQQKQSDDTAQCHNWATQNTGVNPAALAQNAGAACFEVIPARLVAMPCTDVK